MRVLNPAKTITDPEWELRCGKCRADLAYTSADIAKLETSDLPHIVCPLCNYECAVDPDPRYRQPVDASREDRTEPRSMYYDRDATGWFYPAIMLKKLIERALPRTPQGNSLHLLTGFAGCHETETLVEMYLYGHHRNGRWDNQLPDTDEVKSLMSHFHTHGNCGINRHITADRRLSIYTISKLHEYLDRPIA